MRRLNFVSNSYGTWIADNYSIEFYQGMYQPFLNDMMVGPGFNTLKGAISFCQESNENSCLLS